MITIAKFKAERCHPKMTKAFYRNFRTIPVVDLKREFLEI